MDAFNNKRPGGKMKLKPAVLIITCASLPTVGEAQTLLQRNLPVRIAIAIAEKALTDCTDRVSVAVVDRTGRMKVFLQGDNASPHNLELARRKAYTAQTFGRTSR